MNNSFVSGVLACACFLGSFVSNLAEQPSIIRQDTVHNQLDYTQIFKPINLLRSSHKADRLVVVRQHGCDPCDRFEREVASRLKKAEYDVTIIDFSEYDGDIVIEGVPYLIYMKGDKVVQTHEGFQNYLQVTKVLGKPEPVDKETRPVELVAPGESGWEPLGARYHQRQRVDNFYRV